MVTTSNIPARQVFELVNELHRQPLSRPLSRPQPLSRPLSRPFVEFHIEDRNRLTFTAGNGVSFNLGILTGHFGRDGIINNYTWEIDTNSHMSLGRADRESLNWLRDFLNDIEYRDQLFLRLLSSSPSHFRIAILPSRVDLPTTIPGGRLVEQVGDYERVQFRADSFIIDADTLAGSTFDELLQIPNIYMHPLPPDLTAGERDFLTVVDHINRNPSTHGHLESHKWYHEDDTGILVKVEVGDLSEQGFWRAYIIVRNPTPNYKGENDHHYISVPVEMETCKQAVAWTYGLTEAEYDNLVVRT